LGCGCVELKAEASGDHVATVLRQFTHLADLTSRKKRMIDNMYYEPQQIFYNYKTYELTFTCLLFTS